MCCVSVEDRSVVLILPAIAESANPKRMRILFVMDPPSSVRLATDTSFILMWEAQKRGFETEHCLISDLGLVDGHAFAVARRARAQQDEHAPIVLGERARRALADYDAVIIRTDPPFDAAYLWGTLILERARHETVIVNDPRGLREANEKLYACNFPELMAETLVTSDKAIIEQFVDQVGGKAVIKPLGNKGGEGILMLSRGEFNFHPAIESVTERGTRLAMVQRFLPAIHQGDTRIFLLEGKLLGAFRRIPRHDDIRSNLGAGGQVVATTLSEQDEAIIRTLAPRLVQDGLWFVGVDVIGGKLTEVNVTSPTGVQQLSAVVGEPMQARILDALVDRVQRVQRSEPSR